MKLGIGVPQSDLKGDPVAIRDFAQAAEDLGYDHLAFYDHVVGSNPAGEHKGRVFVSKNRIHDPFVLMGFVAAATERVELSTQVLILSQRQTVLVARQAASVDQLSGGRLRLGVGIGWAAAEYQALGEDFSNRGIRSAEQIEVLRHLFTEDHVTFDGRWHSLPDVGLSPPPVQRPIPIWMGGQEDLVMRRIALLGDGWIVIYWPPGEAAPHIEKLRTYVAEAGRPVEAVGIDAWTSVGTGTPDDWRATAEGWKQAGAGYITMQTAFAAYGHQRIAGRTLDDHLKAMRDYHAAVADVL